MKDPIAEESNNDTKIDIEKENFMAMSFIISSNRTNFIAHTDEI